MCLIYLKQDEIKVDMDIHTMEENVGSFFGSMKDESKLSPEQPGKLFAGNPSHDAAVSVTLGSLLSCFNLFIICFFFFLQPPHILLEKKT